MPRPPKPADERQSYKIQIGFAEPERESIQRAADRAGITYSQFVREAAIERAGRHNKKLQRTGYAGR